MAHHVEHSLRASVEAATPTSSTTVDGAVRAASAEAAAAPMFGDVDPSIQLRMELLARASARPETALPFVIELLVEGAERRAAIVEAISTNDALREQWHRTWEVLRR